MSPAVFIHLSLLNLHLCNTALITEQPVAAAVLHQGFATDASPRAQTTAAPHKEPGRPEKGSYHVNGNNGTICLLASMGLQLNITFNSVSQNKVP